MQGNGSDELVVCGWDGMTYIVDLNRNIVRYRFGQNVSAFTAGIYMHTYSLSALNKNVAYIF